MTDQILAVHDLGEGDSPSRRWSGLARSSQLAFVLIALLLAGCATLAPPSPFPPISQQALRSGAGSDLARQQAVETGTIDREDILAANSAMRDFVDRAVAGSRLPTQRLHRLLQAMTANGFLSLDYDRKTTLTAAKTFEQRVGNCLSFTNLFVALARLADLEVEFQLVEIPPIWNETGTWVVVDKHINVVVRLAGMASRWRDDKMVDFNTENYQGNYPLRPITDDHAAALFYSNLGVEAMQKNQPVLALANFAQATRVAPDVAMPWLNLGALYAQRGYPAHASAAYRQALRAEPNHKSTLANLARLHAARGDAELAALFEARVRHYRNQNPYYHYQRGLEALQNQQLDEAQRRVKIALRLKTEEHLFHFLRARIAAQQGDAAQMRRSLHLAERYAERDELKRRYSAKLHRLDTT